MPLVGRYDEKNNKLERVNSCPLSQKGVLKKRLNKLNLTIGINEIDTKKQKTQR